MQVVSIVSVDQHACLIRTSKYMPNSEDQQAVLIKGFLPQCAYRHMHTKLNNCHHRNTRAIGYCISVHSGIIDQAVHSLVM